MSVSELSFHLRSETKLIPRASLSCACSWLHRNFFRNPFHAALSAAVGVLLFYALDFIARWAFLDATWAGNQRTDCRPVGACWAFIANRLGQFAYGFYPESERWRVNAALLLLAGAVCVAALARPSHKLRLALVLVAIYPPVAFWLLHGGFLGLSAVETDRWGGLLLTVVIGMSGIFGSFPVGIVLALGRRSELPLIRLMSAAFIELWRGLPLVMVLFIATVMLPLFLPHGIRPNELALVLVGFIIFQGAFLAETIRGGLQAIPCGQYEAASTLGLGYWLTTFCIILPQALAKVVPGIVNNFIALLKDTTLVMIVGLFDVLNIATAGAADPRWLGSSAEGYVFVGLLFWIICFGLSRYSQRIERRLRTGPRR